MRLGILVAGFARFLTLSLRRLFMDLRDFIRLQYNFRLHCESLRMDRRLRSAARYGFHGLAVMVPRNGGSFARLTRNAFARLDPVRTRSIPSPQSR